MLIYIYLYYIIKCYQIKCNIVSFPLYYNSVQMSCFPIFFVRLLELLKTIRSKITVTFHSKKYFFTLSHFMNLANVTFVYIWPTYLEP